MTPAVHSLVFIAADPFWLVTAGNQTIASIILQREWNNMKVLKTGKKDCYRVLKKTDKRNLPNTE